MQTYSLRHRPTKQTQADTQTQIQANIPMTEHQNAIVKIKRVNGQTNQNYSDATSSLPVFFSSFIDNKKTYFN